MNDARAAVIAYAQAQVGRPYSLTPDGVNSFDCSLLVQKAWAAAGIVLPRNTVDQVASMRLAPISEAQPGDVVTFGQPASHVGVWLSPGYMIDAPNPDVLVGVHGYHYYEALQPMVGVLPIVEGGSPMKAGTLAEAMGQRAGVDYGRWVDGCNKAMLIAGVTTVKRAAMWCAQIGAESGGLQWMEELADGSEYEGRADLGNTQPGDGVRFKGRGPIQITGRSNYAKLSAWCYSKHAVPTPTFFVDHPEQLSLPQYIWLGPVWYWVVARSTLNALSDAGDILGATRAINGGTNGLEGRTQRWQHALTLGAALLPAQVSDESEFLMALSQADQNLVVQAAKVTISRQAQWSQTQQLLSTLAKAQTTANASEAAQLKALTAAISKVTV